MNQCDYATVENPQYLGSSGEGSLHCCALEIGHKSPHLTDFESRNPDQVSHISQWFPYSSTWNARAK